MVADFSIEAAIDNIQNSNTKRYFNEVYQTFVNGNYRSSIVMLYSVLICDLVYKLRDLRDIYNDLKAKKILEDIEALQAANPKSPDWETKLIEFISSRTTLLEPSDIVAIESLQKFRHLSAHPILTNSDLLYTPDKDTVKSLMKNILFGILTNPPFFSNKIFDTLLSDLSDIKDKITDMAGLKKYLTSRYLKQLKDSDFKKVFRSLWKIVFISDDVNAQSNRAVNYKAIQILVNHKKEICLELIKSEPVYYSRISNNDSLTLLSIFLPKFPNIFNLLDSPLQLLLKNHIGKRDNLKFISWYLNGSVEQHLEKLDMTTLSNLSSSKILLLKNIAIANSCLDKFVDVILDYFRNSNSWGDSEDRFNEGVSLIIDDLKLNQLKKLLSDSNSNSQIYGRFGMPAKIASIAVERFESEIDKGKYPKIFY